MQKGLLEKFDIHEQKQQVSNEETREVKIDKAEEKYVAGEMKKTSESRLLDLLTPEKQSNYVPSGFRKKKRKKRYKRLGL